MKLESIMQESVELMEQEFYNKKMYFSYSSLNKLIWNPQVFYQMYVLGMKEERVESHLVQGKIIHVLLLEEDKFNDLFIVSPTSLPTGNLRTVVDRVFNHYKELSRNGDPRKKLEEFDKAILDVLVDMNYHQSLKTDQQRLDKILTPEAFNYWAFLQMRQEKIIIDADTLKFCKNAVEIIKTNQQVCNLLGMNTTEFDNKQVINEEQIQLDLGNKVYGLKGIIDNIVIDYDNKVIYINDIKTTSKDLKDFPESIEYYSYWMQAVIYMMLVTKEHIDLIQSGFTARFHFVVIDRAFQSYAFPVTEKTMNSWLDRFNAILEKAEWHYHNKNYELPYEFAQGLVVL
jgi:hypothetical protein